MDWKTVIISIAGSGVVVGVVAYVFKKAIEKAIATHFEVLKERDKQKLQEETRRSGIIFNRQFEVLSTVLSLVYRSRNAIRDVISAPTELPEMEMRDLLDRVTNYSQAIVNLLYEERSILPESMFKLAHEMGQPLRAIVMNIKTLIREPQDRKENIEKNLRHSYERVDLLYTLLTSEIHKYLKI